jgi:hypothetical protein
MWKEKGNINEEDVTEKEYLESDQYIEGITVEELNLALTKAREKKNLG